MSLPSKNKKPYVLAGVQLLKYRQGGQKVG